MVRIHFPPAVSLRTIGSSAAEPIGNPGHRRAEINNKRRDTQDDAYGMTRWKQAADGFPDFGMTFGNPDFVVFAEAHQAKGRWVETADGLAPALEAAFQEGDVHLIAAPVDYSENTRVLTDELRQPHAGA